jgi:hypothetical protein
MVAKATDGPDPSRGIRVGPPEEQLVAEAMIGPI